MFAETDPLAIQGFLWKFESYS